MLDDNIRRLYESYWRNLIIQTGGFWPSYSEAYCWWKLKMIITELFRDELERHRKATIRVLDIGCGRGTDIFMLNALFRGSFILQFVGIDVSSLAIECANMLKEKRKDWNCMFRVGNAEKLEFDDNAFDIVICSETLEHLQYPEKALPEIYRVLKESGIAIITTPNPKNKAKPFVPKTLMRDIKREEEWCFRRHGITNSSTISMEDRHISLKSSDEWCHLLKKAGFTKEALKRGSLVYGSQFFDRHVMLFAIILALDSILDHLPHTHGFSWDTIFKVRKKSKCKPEVKS